MHIESCLTPIKRIEYFNDSFRVDMDGLLSLIENQRLPGKKLAFSFNGSTLEVEDDEVRVVGRVALVMEKR